MPRRCALQAAGHLFLDNEVPPLAIGLARRARPRSLAGQTTGRPAAALADRAAFHKDLGRAWTRIRAAQAVHREAIAACRRDAGDDGPARTRRRDSLGLHRRDLR